MGELAEALTDLSIEVNGTPDLRVISGQVFAMPSEMLKPTDELTEMASGQAQSPDLTLLRGRANSDGSAFVGSRSIRDTNGISNNVETLTDLAVQTEGNKPRKRRFFAHVDEHRVAELVDRAQEKDRPKDEQDKALSELMDLSYGEVIALARSKVGPEHADDVAHNALIRVLKAIKGGKFQGRASFPTYLYRIVTNTAINHFNHSKRQRDNEGEMPTEDPSPPNRGIGIDVRSPRLLEALGYLTTPVYNAVVAKDVLNLDLEDVAKLLGISVGAAKVRVFRARQQLREMLSDDIIVPPKEKRQSKEAKAAKRIITFAILEELMAEYH